VCGDPDRHGAAALTGLAATFARIEEIRHERLSGRDPEGRWSMYRYKFDLFNNELGSWTATVRDWKRVGSPYKDGDDIGHGVHADPNEAMLMAMRQLGIEP
jgi:hypothetical protein